MGPLARRGETDLRARARAPKVGPIERRRRRKLVDPGKTDDLSAPQGLSRPGELVVVHEARHVLEARTRPDDADGRLTSDVFVELASIHSEERDDPLKPALDRRVDVGGREVDQPCRELREERLELQALLRYELRPSEHHAVKQASQQRVSRRV